MILPEKGTTIKAVSGEKRKFSFDIVWNGTSFAIKGKAPIAK